MGPRDGPRSLRKLHRSEIRLPENVKQTVSSVINAWPDLLIRPRPDEKVTRCKLRSSQWSRFRVTGLGEHGKVTLPRYRPWRASTVRSRFRVTGLAEHGKVTLPRYRPWRAR